MIRYTVAEGVIVSSLKPSPGPVFADFKAARISENAEGRAVITLCEAHWIILLGVAGDDLTVANFAFV